MLTVASGFPTTVNPIIQNRLRPVVVDIELGTYDAIPERLREAVGPKTRAIMMAHTLGNPFDLDTVQELCDKHGLWLVEDSCDALGSTYDGKRTGSFGDTATVSFYPAHHITTGEGGAVFVKSPLVRKQVESFRDWGRDCYCAPGNDNTCEKRFEWQLGDLPKGYDHKYIYSHIGYNLKATDMQAALGLSQLAKLDGFVAGAQGKLRLPDLTAVRRRGAHPAGCHTQVGPVLVRLPDHARSRTSRGPHQVHAVPRRAQDRLPTAVRRQPRQAAGLPQRRLQDRGGPDQHRHRDEPERSGWAPIRA